AIVMDGLEALLEMQNSIARHIPQTSFELSRARLEDVQFSFRTMLGRNLPVGVAVPVLYIQRAISRSLIDLDEFYGKSMTFDSIIQDRVVIRTHRAFNDAGMLPTFSDQWSERQSCSLFPAALVNPDTLEKAEII
ncbi:hypothetical protein ACQV88_26585, partial [Ralstonia pseudosolanacearum]|uniref:hypothetical protein n=1 Tax=Ralstonia pseudosolanacearum TaxID=1310165 RepID=UPI003D2800E8